MVTSKEARQAITKYKVGIESFVFLVRVEERLDRAMENGIAEFTVNVPQYMSEDNLSEAKEVLRDKGFHVRDRHEEGLLEKGLFIPSKRYLIISY